MENQNRRYEEWLRNLPNKLTAFRVLIIPVLCALYSWNYSILNMLCAGLFAVGAITDFLDGYLARKMNSVTKLGEILDPISDKLLVLSALVIMVGADVLSAWIAVLVLCREIAVSGLRLVASEQGFSIKVSGFGKIKTFLQDISITFLLTRIEGDVQRIGMIAFWASVVFSYFSAYEYWTKFWERNKEQL